MYTCDDHDIHCQSQYPGADPRFAPSQWETLLQSNGVSHWLGANLESVLISPWKALTITWKLSWCQLCHQRQHQSFSMIISWHGKTFSHYWSFVKGAHKSLGDSPHWWWWALMLSLLWRTHCWTNSSIADDLRSHDTHVMSLFNGSHKNNIYSHNWQELASLRPSLCPHQKASKSVLMATYKMVPSRITKLASW